jgi:aspartate/methionine/tyrosine aminotransferase
MTFRRMLIEEWFDQYQYEVVCNIGESGIKFRTLDELGIDLGDLPLRYGYHRGFPELRDLIASEYPGLSSANIAVTTGAAEAIFAIVASLVDRDSQTLVEFPNFPSLYMVPESLDREVRLFKLSFDEDFQLDLDRLKNEVTPKTKLVMLCRPNNPIGAIISNSELEKIIEIVESTNAYLLVDETYRELHFDEPPIQAAALSPRAISVTTMSKVYGVPGIRIGWVAANPQIIDLVRAVREQVTICNSVVGEKIAFEVLKQKEKLILETKALLINNLAQVEKWISSCPDLEWISPKAGVVGFPRLVSLNSTERLCKILVEKYKTFTVPGYCFEMPEYFRIGFGISQHELSEGLLRLGMALEDVRR